MHGVVGAAYACILDEVLFWVITTTVTLSFIHMYLLVGAVGDV